MKILLVLIVALSGCATPSPSTEVPGVPDLLPLGTVLSIQQVAHRVQTLDSERKTQAVDALATLTVNDPYTRAAMQIPLALHAAATDIDASVFQTPEARQEWAEGMAGLSAHVALIEELQVELALPAPGDHLHGRSSAGIVDLKTLSASPDPVALTRQLTDDIPELATGLSPSSKQVIDQYSAWMEETTGVARPCPRGHYSPLPGQPWTLAMQLGDTHDALTRVRPSVADLEVAAQLDAMIGLLDSFSEAGFATVAPPAF